MSKEIALTQGEVTTVDDGDYQYLSQWKWHFNNGYARRGVYVSPSRTKMIYMHDEILGIKGVDHRDLNGLNNQRFNLRPASQLQNTANRRMGKNNTSGFKGVYWCKRNGKWAAKIVPKRKQIYLGVFESKGGRG